MSGRTGLTAVEVALLEAVDALEASGAVVSLRPDGPGPDDTDGPAAAVPSVEVLDRLDETSGLGPRHAYPLLVDLAVPWRRHLPLLDGVGNFGLQGDDGAADARYTLVRLGPAGRLALAAERGEVGPVPLGLVEGTLYRGGAVPSFGPAAVVEALRTGSADAGPPVLPTGGLVEGDVAGLLAGRTARIRLACRIVRGHEQGRDLLVVTEVPFGSNPDRIVEMVMQRHDAEVSDGLRGGGRDYLPARLRDAPDDRPLRHPLVADVRDATSTAVGRRIVVALARGADPVDALAWLRDVWPVTVDVEWRLPAPQAERLRGWDAGDGSGLDALAALL